LHVQHADNIGQLGKNAGRSVKKLKGATRRNNISATLSNAISNRIKNAGSANAYAKAYLR
jgi:hypothetical protein